MAKGKHILHFELGETGITMAGIPGMETVLVWEGISWRSYLYRTNNYLIVMNGCGNIKMMDDPTISLSTSRTNYLVSCYYTKQERCTQTDQIGVVFLVQNCTWLAPNEEGAWGRT